MLFLLENTTQQIFKSITNFTSIFSNRNIIFQYNIYPLKEIEIFNVKTRIISKKNFWKNKNAENLKIIISVTKKQVLNTNNPYVCETAQCQGD